MPAEPVVPIIFYRALLLATDTAPIDALCAALAARGLAPAPLIVTSLKDREAAAFLRHAFARLDPALSSSPRPRSRPAARSASRRRSTTADVPVLQVVSATTTRAAWRDSARGLGAADLAMHIVLPELDGRILAGAVAFKDPLPPAGGTLPSRRWRAAPKRIAIAMVADRIAALVRLRRIAARRAPASPC